MEDKLAHAKSEEERARIRQEAAQAAQQLAIRGKHGGGSATKSEKDAPVVNKIKAPGKHEISNDPLDGLDKL